MNAEKKNNMKNWVSTWLTPSLILGAILLGSWKGSEMLAIAKQLMFETVEQRIKTKDHINSDYNEVKNYQLMEEQKQMKIELDTAYAFVNAIFKEDRARIKIDSTDSADAVRSRAKRDSTNLKVVNDIENIQREQVIQTNINLSLLQEMKNIKKLLDTTK